MTAGMGRFRRGMYSTAAGRKGEGGGGDSRRGMVQKKAVFHSCRKKKRGGGGGDSRNEKVPNQAVFHSSWKKGEEMEVGEERFRTRLYSTVPGRKGRRWK